MLTASAHSIDLHCHSTYSDGSLDLEPLLAHVKAHGVSTLAVTDHDSIGIHFALRDLPAVDGIEILSGVEISCSFGNREIHIVGLNFDLDATSLNQFVRQQQTRRRERLLAYANKLEHLNYAGVVAEVENLQSESITRTHLSQILVRLGHVQDAQRAFKRLIGRKARAYVPIEWPSIEQAVDAIVSAGGVAVLAHPARYQLSRKQLVELLDEFSAAGGQAVELAYPNCDPQFTRWITDKALSLNLFGSQGSDFHNPEWRWVKPGYFPPLPKAIEPVWSLWQDK